MTEIRWYAVFKLASEAYSNVLRALLVNSVKSTDNDIDDMLVNVFDIIFDYKDTSK